MTDYHTVNEDDGSMLISVSRETNHHGNNADIENKSSEPDENEKESRGGDTRIILSRI